MENQIKVKFGLESTRKVQRYLVPSEERLDLLKSVSDGAVILFLNGYLEKSLGSYNGNSLSISDFTMAEHLGWKINKVARLRRELMAKHFFLARQYKSTDALASKAEIVFLGKEAVTQHLLESKKGSTLSMINTHYEVEAIDIKAIESR